MNLKGMSLGPEEDKVPLRYAETKNHSYPGHPSFERARLRYLLQAVPVLRMYVTRKITQRTRARPYR